MKFLPFFHENLQFLKVFEITRYDGSWILKYLKKFGTHQFFLNSNNPTTMVRTSQPVVFLGKFSPLGGKFFLKIIINSKLI